MPRETNRLSAVGVTACKQPGYHPDGGGLYLRVTADVTKSWVFRFTLRGKRRDAGLGRFPAVTLLAAREAAQRYRQLVAAGIDPIDQRQAERVAARIAEARAMTFRQSCEAYIAAHEVSWRNPKHRAQWASTLGRYAYPVIGNLPVSAIDTGLVVKVLEPIWSKKPETASRLRGRIETVLNWAKVRALRDGANPAAWRGHLDQLLPAKGKVRRVRHHAALPYRDVPALVTRVRLSSSVSSRALEFAILTAARTSEVLGARWEEISLDAAVWTIPAHRMKGGRVHRVPLSNAALAILSQMAEVRQSDFVFAGAKLGRPLSQMALLMALRRLNSGDVTTHGFRSSFRDWAAEQTNFPREVCEAALAHVVPDAVEAAYRRSDLFERRTKLMEAWAGFCGRQAANVVMLRQGAR